jgi:glutamyl-Q tRNA(Asp) synthetase
VRPVFRFAPSPNGRLHLGHAGSALLNERLAAACGGRLLLRIEDIDQGRCRPAYEAAIHDDLAWLGLVFETPVRRQSDHWDTYRRAATALKRKGLLYPCFCSRREVGEAVSRHEAEGRAWPRDPDGTPLYPGTCRHRSHRSHRSQQEVESRLAAGEAPAWRLDMAAALAAVPGPFRYRRFDPGGGEGPVEAHPGRWGDAVVVRKDVPASYHLAVVVDDAIQGVSHVVRGRDLEAATDLHVLLQRILGLPSPLYHHHALILDPMGGKLSKSRGSEALSDLRARGVRPEEIRRHLGFSPDAQDLQPHHAGPEGEHRREGH